MDLESEERGGVPLLGQGRACGGVGNEAGKDVTGGWWDKAENSVGKSFQW